MFPAVGRIAREQERVKEKPRGLRKKQLGFPWRRAGAGEAEAGIK